MRAHQKSFVTHLQNSLFKSGWTIAVSIAIITSLAVGIVSIHEIISTKRETLKGLSFHLSTLIDSNDRIEVLRLLSSISRNDNSDVSLIVDDIEFANSYNNERLDQKFIKDSHIIEVFGSFLNSKHLIIYVPILKTIYAPQSGILVYRLPIKNLLPKILISLFVSFTLSIIALYYLNRRLKIAIDQSLSPLEDLQKEIRNFQNQDQKSSEISIIEFEEIRQTIIHSKKELKLANEKVASQKAKEINSEIYRRLIHDLQNPLAALKTMVSLISSEETNESIKSEAIDSIIPITEEILNQIIAAKKNFEFDCKSLISTDLRVLIEETIKQVNAAFPSAKNKIVFESPSAPVFYPCDKSTLKRSLINIIENGLEVCRERIDISLMQTRGCTSIFISDDGNGLDELKFNEMISGKGFSNKGDRQALGLSSANHIVQIHGGKLINQRSQLGGACIEMRLGQI